MKKIVLTLILTGFILSVPTFAKTEIGGVTLPDTLKIGDETLVLNGGGIREKFWLDMYVGGLYLTQKEINSQKIIGSDQLIRSDDFLGIYFFLGQVQTPYVHV